LAWPPPPLKLNETSALACACTTSVRRCVQDLRKQDDILASFGRACPEVAAAVEQHSVQIWLHVINRV
jgi:hypothetical protein